MCEKNEMNKYIETRLLYNKHEMNGSTIIKNYSPNSNTILMCMNISGDNPIQQKKK
jgi:hypothetical protein